MFSESAATKKSRKRTGKGSRQRRFARHREHCNGRFDEDFTQMFDRLRLTQDFEQFELDKNRLSAGVSIHSESVPINVVPQCIKSVSSSISDNMLRFPELDFDLLRLLTKTFAGKKVDYSLILEDEWESALYEDPSEATSSASDIPPTSESAPCCVSDSLEPSDEPPSQLKVSVIVDVASTSVCIFAPSPIPSTLVTGNLTPITQVNDIRWKGKAYLTNTLAVAKQFARCQLPVLLCTSTNSSVLCGSPFQSTFCKYVDRLLISRIIVRSGGELRFFEKSWKSKRRKCG